MKMMKMMKMKMMMMMMPMPDMGWHDMKRNAIWIVQLAPISMEPLLKPESKTASPAMVFARKLFESRTLFWHKNIGVKMFQGNYNGAANYDRK